MPWVIIAKDTVGPVDLLELVLSFQAQRRVIRKSVRVPDFGQIAVALFDFRFCGVNAKIKDSQCTLDIVHRKAT